MRLGSRSLIAIIAGSLLASPTIPAAAAEDSCAAQYETVQMKTFHVVIQTPRKVYKIDNVVPINVEVTRPAHEDPLGQDQPIDPPVSEPAEGVNVGVGLQVGRSYLFGIGMTDADGKTSIRVPLPSYLPEGNVFARSLAWNILVNTTCLIVEEQGYTEERNFFRVTR